MNDVVNFTEVHNRTPIQSTPKEEAPPQPHRLGARLTSFGVSFLVWAPDRKRVSVRYGDGRLFPLTRDAHGNFFGVDSEAKAGDRYKYLLDNGQLAPDPCSFFQPEGPHGDSQIVDPSAFRWSDQNWSGVSMRGQVLYEMHIGTFTQQGNYRAAEKQLPTLKKLGITTIEVMPLAESAGRWNWGYDGVNLFAPYHVYGKPDELKSFVDRAHALRMGVILDVVYNHLGPDGNYLGLFARDYFSKKHKTDWGKAINFDGPASEHVRRFFIENARHWIEDYHFDGLRLDATQDIHDDSPLPILGEISTAVRDAAAPKKIIFVAENEPQDVRCLADAAEGGYGLDAMWNDDFHHSARVAVTGFREAYFTDYRGDAQELISLAKQGFLFQGQYYQWQKKRRGTSSRDVSAERLVVYTQNHDQVANSITGNRLNVLCGDQRYRALMAYVLLLPQTPMLFMGQEYGVRRPFRFFSDHHEELQKKVCEGRIEFLAQFPSYGTPSALRQMPRRSFEKCFVQSQLSAEDRRNGRKFFAFHRDLIAMRKNDLCFAAQRKDLVDGAVLNEEAFALRWFDDNNNDRLMVVNLGKAAQYSPVPEPILASPPRYEWQLSWSSDDKKYGGSGKFIQLKQGRVDMPAFTTSLFQLVRSKGERHDRNNS